MLVWNLLMGAAVIGAFIQAAVLCKVGTFVLGGVVTFVLLAVIGFSGRREDSADDYV